MRVFDSINYNPEGCPVVTLARQYLCVQHAAPSSPRRLVHGRQSPPRARGPSIPTAWGSACRAWRRRAVRSKSCTRALLRTRSGRRRHQQVCAASQALPVEDTRRGPQPGRLAQKRLSQRSARSGCCREHHSKTGGCRTLAPAPPRARAGALACSTRRSSRRLCRAAHSMQRCSLGSR